MPLRVDTNVPYGNAADVEVAAGADPIVSFSASSHGGPEAMWFCFRVLNEPPRLSAGRLRLVLRNPGNLLGGGDPAMIRPVIRQGPPADADPEMGWRRLPPGTVLSLPDGRSDVFWETDVPLESADVALCYPYGMPEVRRLVAESGGYWRPDSVGLSQGGRPLVRLSNGYGEVGDEDGKKAGVYFVARQHSGETPGSWVMDGLLRQLADDRVGDLVVWCVPLANIDGVELGDYGKDNFPYDLNRAWGRPPMRHETLVIQSDVTRWRSRTIARLALDFHAPGLCEDTGVYAFGAGPEKLDDGKLVEQTRWLGAMASALGPFARIPFLRVARYASRWDSPSASEFFRSIPGVFAATLETSYLSAGRTEFTVARYREAGRRLAGAIVSELRR